MSTETAVKTAPAFELSGTDGQRYSLKEASARGPVLLAFFKVSCPTCQLTFPFIERLYHQFGTRGTHIWGISQDNASDSRHFAKQFGVTFPILVDEKPYEVSRRYRLKYTPTLFLIDSNGQVELSGDGFSKRDLLEIQTRLAQHYSLTPAPVFLPSEKLPEYKPG